MTYSRYFLNILLPILLIFCSLPAKSNITGLSLNFEQTDRSIIVSPTFLNQLVKASGKIPQTDTIVVKEDIATRYIQLQQHSLAPLNIIAQQDKLQISWLQPKANTSELLAANSENQIIARNLFRFLFGNDALVSSLREKPTMSINTLSHNQKWRIEAIRNGISYSVVIQPN